MRQHLQRQKPVYKWSGYNAGKRVLQSIKSEDTDSNGKSVGYKHYKEGGRWGADSRTAKKRFQQGDETKDGLLVPKTRTEGPQTRA